MKPNIAISLGALIVAAAVVPALAVGQGTPTAPQGNAATGARLFLQCRACHTVGAADKNSVGPNLFGIVGAKAGAKAGYNFSPALKASGRTWNAATLDAWLKRPTALVPGNKMAFAGVPSAQSRADLIAYMTMLKPAKR